MPKIENTRTQTQNIITCALQQLLNIGIIHTLSYQEKKKRAYRIQEMLGEA
jgi:hypothetical protein